MLRKLAVALIAATVFTAPVFAQSTAPANPPAKTNAAPAANAPAAATPTSPKVVAAKPGLKHAKHHRRLAHHHVKRVKHAMHVKAVKHAKHATHVKLAQKATHHRAAKATKKAPTYMRAASVAHPAAVKTKKPAKHTVKTTHRVKHVRLAKKSTTHARSDAPAAPKSVN